MDKNTNCIDYHPHNPQETKSNLYKHPHILPQLLPTKQNTQYKTKITDNQKEKPPPLNIAYRKTVDPPPKTVPVE